MHYTKALAALCCLSAISIITHTASAAVIGVTDEATLGANDTVDWGQLGAYGTALTGPLAVTSNGGLSAMVFSSGNSFITGQEEMLRTQPEMSVAISRRARLCF